MAKLLSTLLALQILAHLAAAWSPTGGYAPGKVACPAGSLVRTAEGISLQEALWVAERNKVTDVNLASFLNLAGLEDFDVDAFLANTTDGRSIKIGIAFSGGGYRAMTSGAGMLNALDSRATNANSKGLGGLLQSSTYLAGLSGGSWLVGTVAMNNYSSVEQLIATGEIWQLEDTILNFGGWNILKSIEYWVDIWTDISAKFLAGFPVSVTDLWGRALAHQFFRKNISYGSSLEYAQLQTMNAFTSHQMPFPLIVAVGRKPGSIIINGNSTVFEFNAFEMGSWDPTLYLFTQTEYLGTSVSNGVPSGNCIGGYDNAGFVMGTSSSIFNSLLLDIDKSLPTLLKGIITPILNLVFGNFELDISVFQPNPFAGSTVSATAISQSDDLYLVDGGEDGQNIPLNPMIQPERDLDVIFAYDNSADTDDNYPDGSSLVATFQRQFWKQGNGTIFPYVPSTSVFLSEGLTQKPTFFGCNALDLEPLLKKGQNVSDVYKSPLIVYTANREFSYDSGKSTFKLSYSNSERDSMIQNGFEVATRDNLELDSEFAACVSCAIIRREQERQGIAQTDQCQQCFEKYCWYPPSRVNASTVSPEALYASMSFHVPATAASSDISIATEAAATDSTVASVASTVTASSIEALVSLIAAQETLASTTASAGAAATTTAGSLFGIHIDLSFGL